MDGLLALAASKAYTNEKAGNWRKIADIALETARNSVDITLDDDGEPFALTGFLIHFDTPIAAACTVSVMIQNAAGNDWTTLVTSNFISASTARHGTIVCKHLCDCWACLWSSGVGALTPTAAQMHFGEYYRATPNAEPPEPTAKKIRLYPSGVDGIPAGTRIVVWGC